MSRRLQTQEKRVLRDVKDIMTCPIPGIILSQFDESNYKDFKVTIAGPIDSPFESGSFDLSFHITYRFPFVAPLVKFVTPVFHPNIHYDGTICVDILSEWAEGTTLLQVANVIQRLLKDSYTPSPLNVEAALMLDLERDLYNKTVQMWTAVFAGGNCRPQNLEDKLLRVLDKKPWTEETALKKLSANNWDVKVVLDTRRD